jgi:hypothetical protein
MQAHLYSQLQVERRGECGILCPAIPSAITPDKGSFFGGYPIISMQEHRSAHFGRRRPRPAVKKNLGLGKPSGSWCWRHHWNRHFILTGPAAAGEEVLVHSLLKAPVLDLILHARCRFIGWCAPRGACCNVILSSRSSISLPLRDKVKFDDHNPSGFLRASGTDRRSSDEPRFAQHTRA